MSEIKALEWEAVEPVGGWTWMTIAKAETPFGRYTLDRHDKGFFLRVLFGNQRIGHFDDDRRDEAEKAAQSDYEARIRSALVERKAEPVAWLCSGEGEGWKQDNRITFDREEAEKLIGVEGWTVKPLGVIKEHVTPPAAAVRAEPVATVEIRDLKGGGGMRGLGHIQPEHWWAKQPSGTYYIYPAPQTMAALSASPSPVDSRDDRDFLHRLIENAFSWALQDCNYLNPKYMDRLIDCTHDGMKPEHAAVWNATAPEQEARALAAKEHQPSTDVKSDECGHPFDDTFKTAIECIAANKCLCGLKHDRGAAAKEQQP